MRQMRSRFLQWCRWSFDVHSLLGWVLFQSNRPDQLLRLRHGQVPKLNRAVVLPRVRCWHRCCFDWVHLVLGLRCWDMVQLQRFNLSGLCCWDFLLDGVKLV